MESPQRDQVGCCQDDSFFDSFLSTTERLKNITLLTVENKITLIWLQGHDLCQALPGPTQRYSSPTLIMEVVGDDDEKIEVKDKDVSHLESGK